MQHFRVKVFATTTPGFELGNAIPVFHRWIQKHALEELLLDVADYRHVPAGPGIVLVGHDSHYNLDQNKDRLGLLYARRTVLDGEVADRIRQALDRAQTACSMLEREPEFVGNLRFASGELEISVNDRALAPNNEETFRALEPVIRAVLDERLGSEKYSLERIGDPRELFTVVARARG